MELECTIFLHTVIQESEYYAVLCDVIVMASTKNLLLSLCYRCPCLGTIVFLPQEEIPAKQESAMQSVLYQLESVYVKQYACKESL